jgi:hypothetical protein
MKKIITLLLVLALLGFTTTNAQTPTSAKPPVSQALYNQIAQLDSLLFAAYNNQDIATMKKFFSTDLEWYQDNGGLIYYDQVFKNFESILQRDSKISRTLVKGSLSVFAIKDYGAVQTGEHRFCHIENGKDDCGIFKFIMLWQQKEGEWKITRVISYDH